MSNRIFKLAIDGPSGVGKSTTANTLAERLEFVRIDSGTLYRALTHILLKEYKDINTQILLKNEQQINNFEFTISTTKILYDNENIKPMLKTAIIDKNVSIVAKQYFVREKIKKMQYKLINDLEKDGCEGIIIDGRDIGTVILPDADLKVYLTANAKVRAQRRWKENGEGEYEKVYCDMIRRDKEDIEREHGPLRKAEDAVEVDNSEMSFEEQIEVIYKLVTERIGNK